MDKSPERIKLEEETRAILNDSQKIAWDMVNDEFNGDLDAALSNEDFVKRMQKQISETWKNYLNNYKKLEELEKKEGYPAMKFYASQLDLIEKHLPNSNKEICYYPFSGVDFYWTRIFKKLICEDISFSKSKLPNNWWEYETYQKRKEIEDILKEQNIIPKDSELEIIIGDAEIKKQENMLNKPNVTLLVKGGHSVLNYIEKRYSKEKLLFGAIITVTSADTIEEMDKRLKKEGYKKIFSYKGEDFLVPYALSLRDVHIFAKET